MEPNYTNLERAICLLHENQSDFTYLKVKQAASDLKLEENFTASMERWMAGWLSENPRCLKPIL
jgi:hypothetical protein